MSDKIQEAPIDTETSVRVKMGTRNRLNQVKAWATIREGLEFKSVDAVIDYVCIYYLSKVANESIKEITANNSPDYTEALRSMMP